MNRVNIQRFTGFADIYDKYRPRPPKKVIEIATQLTGKERFGTVVDLGCGTGLSTAIWNGSVDKVIGIEPTSDMRDQAIKNFPDIEFINANSHTTTLNDSTVDIVTCSQAFHWMEPEITLAEINRILKDNGLLLIYDNIWPVSWDQDSERAYKELINTAILRKSELHDEGNKSPHQFPKDKHLDNIIKSGYFARTGKINFDSEEECNSERFVGIVLSQGLIQDIIKTDVSVLEKEIENLKLIAGKADTSSMRVSYVLNYGIKKSNV